MAAPATSRASGEASPEAPIRAAMVSVVAAVGATLVIEAIQSPRSPTDLSRSPDPAEGSLVMTGNLSGAWRRPGLRQGQDGGPAVGDDGPVSGVGDGDSAIAAGDEGVLGFRAADRRVPGERGTG